MDLNGNGVPEILLTAAFASAPSRPKEMFCFSSGGKLLWRYSPNVDIQFSTQGLKGPWKFLYVLVVPGKPFSTIWASVAHDIWWPSFIVRISATGVARLAFVNSGNIHALQRIENDAGSFILAAGVNNEYRQAAIGIISENAPPSVSPQTTGSEFACVRGCPGGRPYRYILMPRSEVNVASEKPYNTALRIVSGTSGFSVETDEMGVVGAFYEFSKSFDPERVRYGSNYRVIHERFEKEGRLDHVYEDCPERNSRAALRICDENGNWSTSTIPRLRPYE